MLCEHLEAVKKDEYDNIMERKDAQVQDLVNELMSVEQEGERLKKSKAKTARDYEKKVKSEKEATLKFAE